MTNRDLAWCALSGSDFRGADLGGAELTGADLFGARLDGATLRMAMMSACDLRGASLRGADLRGACLRDADLRGADLRDAQLEDAVLCGALLHHADLRAADLSGANLDRCAMNSADARRARLSNTSVREADLRGADLRGTWLDQLRQTMPRPSIQGILISPETRNPLFLRTLLYWPDDTIRWSPNTDDPLDTGPLSAALQELLQAKEHDQLIELLRSMKGAPVVLHGTYEELNFTEGWPHPDDWKMEAREPPPRPDLPLAPGAVLVGVDLERAALFGLDLQSADLRDANLAGAELGRAKLDGADLRGADLRWACLERATLTRADLRGADLRGARLKEATLNWAELTGVCHDTMTRWPKGFSPPPPGVPRPHTISPIWRRDPRCTRRFIDRIFGEMSPRHGLDLVMDVLRGEERPIDLHAADLSGMELTGWDLEDVFLILEKANLQRTTLREVELIGACFRGAELNGALLERCSLDKGDFVGACLDGSVLRGCSLQGADLRGATAVGTLLQQVDLRGADLRGVDLREARLEAVALQGCRWDEETQWPPGILPHPRPPQPPNDTQAQLFDGV